MVKISTSIQHAAQYFFPRAVKQGMKHYSYDTFGTCSARIEFDIEDGRVHNVVFLGGCNGNLQGIGRLVEGMAVNDVIDKLEGISCQGGPTSCPDQLSRALREASALQG